VVRNGSEEVTAASIRLLEELETKLVLAACSTLLEEPRLDVSVEDAAATRVDNEETDGWKLKGGDEAMLTSEVDIHSQTGVVTVSVLWLTVTHTNILSRCRGRDCYSSGTNSLPSIELAGWRSV
jgi:hypothetical protein